MVKMLGALVMLVTLGGVAMAQEPPTISVRPRTRQVLLRQAPLVDPEVTKVFIHTWVRKYVGEGETGPRYETWQISDGPYEAGPRVDRMVRTIGREGLHIGINYFPVQTVLLVEVRTQ
jgi:hypothetical protein